MKFLLLFLIVFSPFALQSNDWEQVFFGERPMATVVSMTCADSNNCFVLAQFPDWVRIYKSTDRGANWNKIYQSDPLSEGFPLLVNVNKGCSPHPEYYFMAMWERPVIKKSIDGGKTFNRISIDTMDAKSHRKIYEFAMRDTNIGIAFSGDWYFVTQDGWETFQKYPSTIYEGYYSPIFFNDSIVVMTYSSGIDEFDNLFKSYNINQNIWEILFEFKKEPDSDYQNSIHRIFFVNGNLGFGCGELNTGAGESSYDLIYRTTNGGYDWEIVLKELKNPPFGLQDIAFYDAKNGVAVGAYGKIWTTNDSGNTWVINEVPGEMDVMPTTKVVWAGQYPIVVPYDIGSGIFRYEGDFFDFTPDTTDTTDVEEYIKNILGDIEVKAHFYRSQLYVSINDEHFRKYKLQIFDIMGNVAMVQELSSGVGTLYVPVDISKFPSGVYFYSINIDGIEFYTGKFSVIK